MGRQNKVTVYKTRTLHMHVERRLNSALRWLIISAQIVFLPWRQAFLWPKYVTALNNCNGFHSLKYCEHPLKYWYLDYLRHFNLTWSHKDQFLSFQLPLPNRPLVWHLSLCILVDIFNVNLLFHFIYSKKKKLQDVLIVFYNSNW